MSLSIWNTNLWKFWSSSKFTNVVVSIHQRVLNGDFIRDFSCQILYNLFRDYLHLFIEVILTIVRFSSDIFLWQQSVRKNCNLLGCKIARGIKYLSAIRVCGLSHCLRNITKVGFAPCALAGLKNLHKVFFLFLSQSGFLSSGRFQCPPLWLHGTRIHWCCRCCSDFYWIA